MILDFALEDARIKQKKEDRRIKRKEENKKKEVKKKEDDDELKLLKLEDVTDPDLLLKIAQFTSSRGRKQRALKKLKKLQGANQEKTQKQEEVKKEVKSERQEEATKQKEVAEKRREKALGVRKSREANLEIEKEIVGKLKQKRKKKEQTDGLDKLLYSRKNLFTE